MQDIQLQRQATAEAITQQLVDNCSSVFADYPIVVAYLHGSVARKNPLPTSDIDIALVFDGDFSGYERLQLELKIQSELEDTCGLREIDVRSIDNAPLLVQGRIVQEGIRIYEGDRSQRINFEVMTRKLYFDYLITLKKAGLIPNSAI